MTATSDRTVHILISGRVQGVGFRAWLRNKAQGLGLKGWVRNIGNDRVEAVLCGPPDDIETVLEACDKGPKWARVDHVEQQPTTGFPGNGFAVMPTL